MFFSCVCTVSSAHLFIVAENERRFGNKDDSKNKWAGGSKPEDAATLVEQEDGEGDDQDRGGEEDGRGVAEGKPERGLWVIQDYSKEESVNLCFV